jgi:hypothetical protein
VLFYKKINIEEKVVARNENKMVMQGLLIFIDNSLRTCKRDGTNVKGGSKALCSFVLVM